MGKDILLVEDHPLVAESTKSYLEGVIGQEGQVVIAGCASTAIESLRIDLRRWRLILLDLRIPGAVGLSGAMQIKDLGLASITCLHTAEDRPDYVVKVREQGFLGYILKGGKITVFETAFANVLAGRPSFPIVNAQRQLLTSLQVEVLQLLHCAKTPMEIARRLDMRPAHINNCISAAAHALGSHSKSETLERAIALGLISDVPRADRDAHGLRWG
jgi:DNA-binding NarL/FixJ family response regulator